MATTENYNFDLPEGLIAQDPTDRRGDSRLLLVEPDEGLVGEQVFRQLPQLLRSGDLLIFNQSRVLPARLLTTRIDSGGHIEILLVRPHSGQRTWLAMAKPARRLRPGIKLAISSETDQSASGHNYHLEVIGNLGEGQVLVQGVEDPNVLAEKWGEVPLPPYIRRQYGDPETQARHERDRRRYQTVYAAGDKSGAGSVAAPTAGLHFSEQTLSQLIAAGVQLKYVSLHVGPGTFKPPSEEQITNRRLHQEFFHLPTGVSEAMAATKKAGGRIIAVGTTSLRVLETVARLELADQSSGKVEFDASETNPEPVFIGHAEKNDGFWEVAGSTRLFINPPDRVTAVDGLLTNFHLPESSLLMLVAALMGPQVWRPVYEHAVTQKMRFYSYGDCMLILPELGLHKRGSDS